MSSRRAREDASEGAPSGSASGAVRRRTQHRGDAASAASRSSRTKKRSAAAAAYSPSDTMLRGFLDRGMGWMDINDVMKLAAAAPRALRVALEERDSYRELHVNLKSNIQVSWLVRAPPPAPACLPPPWLATRTERC